MRKIVLALVGLVVLAVPAIAQQPLPNEFVAVGVGYDNTLSKHAIPSINFGIMAAHTTGIALYAVSGVQVTGVSRHPLQAQTVMTEDACAVTRLIGEYVAMGVCGGPGVAATGTNVGGAIDSKGWVGYRFKGGNKMLAVQYGEVKTALSKWTPALSINFVIGFKG